jgi:hypothetical protein
MKESADPNSNKMKAEFRQKLEHFQAAPSAGLWDRIDLSLEKEEALAYKNRMRLYARLAAACLLLLIAFSGVFIILNLQKFKAEAPGSLTIAKTSDTKEESTGKETDQHAAGSGAIQENGQLALKEFQVKDAVSAATKNSDPEEKKTVETVAKLPKNLRLIAMAKLVKNKTKKYREAEIAASSKTNKITVNPKDETTIAMTVARLNGSASANQPLNYGRVLENVISNEIAATEPIASASFSAGNKNPELKLFSAEVAENLDQKHHSNFAGNRVEEKVQNFALESLAFGGTKAAVIPEEILNKPAAKATANLLATLNASCKEETEPELQVRASRWAVRLVYGGSAFKPGMALANQQPEYIEEDSMGSSLLPPVQSKRNTDYQDAIDEFNRNTYSAFSNKISLLAGFKITGNISLQSGLQFIQNRAKTTSSYLFPRTGDYAINQMPTTFLKGSEKEAVLPAIMHQTDPDPLIMQTEPFKAEYRYYYVGLPLDLRFQTNSSNAYGFVATGFSINRLLRAESRNNHPQYANVQVENNIYRKWLPAMQVQAGAGFPLSKTMQVEIALEATRFLVPLLQDEQVAGAAQKMPFNLGASVGLVHTF